MPVDIRPATLADLPRMVELLMLNAEDRRAHNHVLWPIVDDADAKVEEAVRFALAAEKQPLRQQWLVANAAGMLVGITHSVLLPVPPIYAGNWGDPGLLMPECFITQAAPAGTLEALLDAAETDLRRAGAEIFLASFIAGDALRSCFSERGYQPITLYLAKSGFANTASSGGARAASESDVEGIVRRSAEHRQILLGLDPFWTPHPEADTRFGNWMRRSLTLQDRDMLVVGPQGSPEGYAIAQPASRLHFPPAHDISETGVVDDYFHNDYSNPSELQGSGRGAASLLGAAEAAFARRGIRAALVVCPALWTSKVTVLENAGYRTAMTWMIRR